MHLPLYPGIAERPSSLAQEMGQRRTIAFVVVRVGKRVTTGELNIVVGGVNRSIRRLLLSSKS